MTAGEVLNQLRQHRIEIRPNGSTLLLRPPDGVEIGDELAREIRRHKPALRWVLSHRVSHDIYPAYEVWLPERDWRGTGFLLRFGVSPGESVSSS